MVIQYPGKLDKSRPVHVTLDHTSSKDQQIYNTIIGKLKAAGINVQSPIGRTNIGPNEFAEAYIALKNRGETNAVLVGVVNGIDPTNIKEVGLQSYDNTGTAFRKLGNDVVLAYFYDSCDGVNEDGRCYKRVRERNPQTDVPTGKYFAYPSKYAKNNKIYMVAACSDEGTKRERADYTGEGIAQKIIELFETGADTTDPTTTDPTNTPVITNDGTKTITTRTITKSYSAPYYQKVFKTTTDENGAFKVQPKLPYRGEYTVTMRFAGDREHNASTSTVKIYNFDDKCAVFKETLLHTKIITKYSDNTTSTEETGKLPDDAHVKRVITTETYENGVVKSTSTRTIYVDEVLWENPNPTSTTTTDTVVTDPNDNTVVPVVDNGPRVNPFTTVVNSVNGVPQVTKMQVGDKQFVMASLERGYTLTLAQYHDVYYRDSKTMQLQNYKLSKYVAFESTDTNTYNVVERGIWNFVTESVHQWLVRHNSAPWPESYVVDFKNKQTKVGTEWVTWKGYLRERHEDENGNPYWTTKKTGDYGVATDKCGLYVVGDRQDDYYRNGTHYGYVTCGPTSASVCSQYLMNYYSEFTIADSAKTNGSGTGPDEIISGLSGKHLKGSKWNVENDRQVAVDWLKTGRPLIWHIYKHYICFVQISDYNGSVLVCNSSGSGWDAGGRLGTGWNPQSNIRNDDAFGQHVKVDLNWTISDVDAAKFKNFFQSMGGAWVRPSSDETVRRYRNGE